MDLMLSESLEKLLVCPVCKRELVKPITLSCGSTICQSCLPPPTVFENNQLHQHRLHQSFICPVQQCKSTAHLFGPNQETHIDEPVQQLCQLKSSLQGPPFNKGARHETDSIRRECIEIIWCSKCFQVVNEPITTHCGHVYCRLCLLKLRITSDICTKCLRPLPQYTHIQNEAMPNSLLQSVARIIAPERKSTADVPFLSSSSETKNVNMYISGLVILPGQQARLPIFAPAHLRMLQRAVFSCDQYEGICIATVHRGRPNIAQFGTIVQIVSIEHQTSSSIVMDVVGRSRFRVTDTHTTDDNHRGDPSILMADFQLVPEDDAEKLSGNAQAGTDIYKTAQRIHDFLTKMGSIPPPAGSSSLLTASSDGLIGPLWFETMQRIHGPLPNPNYPAAVGWWAAVVLPVSGAERYALLRTIALVDRLTLITSWIRQLGSQWNRSRRTAIEQVNQGISDQYSNPIP